MASLFISYSRKNIETARKLTEAFKGQDLDFWIDWQGIPPTVDWWKEIEKGIEEADIFLFLISPDSCKSKVCKQEIEHAVKNGKRLIPLVVSDVTGEQAPAELSHLNWIFIRETDDFDLAFEKLISAIKTDYAWVQAHRELQVKALEWERSNHENSFLLFGKELHDAEFQLATNSSKEPHPTDLQREYVHRSRKAVDRRRARNTGITTVAAIALAALAIFGFVQADRAEERAVIARAGELAALAISEKDSHYGLGLLLSIEAIRVQENTRTESALFSLLDSHRGLNTYLNGANGPVSTVAYSPDGKILASASNLITLWDVSNATNPVKIAGFPMQTEAISSIAFTSDNKIIATGGSDNLIILWDISNSARPMKLATLSEPSDMVTSVAFDPQDKMLAAGSRDGTISLWDVSDPAKPIQLSGFIETYNSYTISSIDFSTDGTILASGSQSDTITLWDIRNPESPKELSSFYGPFGNAPMNAMHEVYSVAFSPDGKTLASGRSYDTLVLWDVSNPVEPSELSILSEGSGAFLSVAFSPDGKRLASGARDGTVFLWNITELSKPLKLLTLSGHSDIVHSVAFSPDGNHLASGSQDSTIILWDINNPTSLVRPFTISAGSGDSLLGALAVAFSPDGKRIAFESNDEGIVLWDITDVPHPALSSTLSDSGWEVSSIAFRPDGEILASGTRKHAITLWDVSDISNPVKMSFLPDQGDEIYDMAFSSDGKTLASSGPNGTVILWDVGDVSNPVEISTLSARSSSMHNNIAFSRDGNVLASGSEDGSITLWDVGNASNPVMLSTLSGHTSVAFNPLGTMLASSSGQNIYLWDVSDLSNPVKLSTMKGHIRAISSLTFSHDGERLASGSDDSTIIVWDVNNSTNPVRLFTLSGHTSGIFSIMFSPTSNSLVSAGRDHTVSLWDLDLQSWLQKACHRAGRNLTPQEWASYFPNEEYRKTCKA